MAKHQLCRNCGSKVTGNYCSTCGQRTATHRLGWASLVESVTSTFVGDEAYGLRGIHMRKGAVMTWFSILWQPHRAIGEFIEGHRRKYFNPLAILLMLSTVYTVIFMLVGKEYTAKAVDGQPFFKWIFYTYIDYSTLHPAGYLLLALPVYALAMKTVFRRKTALSYVEFLYIGIFLAIFEVTLMIVALPAEVLLPWYSEFYLSTLPVYLYTAFVFWKIFGLGKRTALLRTLLVTLLQYVYMFLTVSSIVGCVIAGYCLFAPEKLTVGNNRPVTEQQEPLLEEVLHGFLDGLRDPAEDEEQTPIQMGDATPETTDSCRVSPETGRAQ